MGADPEEPYHMINIKDRTLEELMTFELKDTKSQIATLKDSFEILKERSAPFMINVEIKDPEEEIVEAVFTLAKEVGVFDQIFISSFHHYHAKTCENYSPSQPFGFLSDIAQDLPVESMMTRKCTPGDAFILNFESIYRDLNRIAPLLQKLKDKGYNWSYWFSNGTKRETLENTFRALTGDWTHWKHVDASKL